MPLSEKEFDQIQCSLKPMLGYCRYKEVIALLDNHREKYLISDADILLGIKKRLEELGKMLCVQVGDNTEAMHQSNMEIADRLHDLYDVMGGRYGPALDRAAELLRIGTTPQ